MVEVIITRKSLVLFCSFVGAASALLPVLCSEPVFVNVKGTQESIPGLLKTFANTGSGSWKADAILTGCRKQGDRYSS